MANSQGLKSIIIIAVVNVEQIKLHNSLALGQWRRKMLAAFPFLLAPATLL